MPAKPDGGMHIGKAGSLPVGSTLHVMNWFVTHGSSTTREICLEVHCRRSQERTVTVSTPTTETEPSPEFLETVMRGGPSSSFTVKVDAAKVIGVSGRVVVGSVDGAVSPPVVPVGVPVRGRNGESAYPQHAPLVLGEVPLQYDGGMTETIFPATGVQVVPYDHW